jgi:DNA replication and repair protein RecF
MELDPGKGLNLIYGDNGAGKTSILEAIFLLGQGKSFRHSEAGPLISKGEKSARVVADLQANTGVTSKLGIQRNKQRFVARNSGQDVSRRSELFRLLPLQLITPQSHELIERGPELRRRYLDFGLFHVEQSYHQTLMAYQRALKQRNAALRSGDIRLARSFDEQLVVLSDTIIERRVCLLSMVKQQLAAFLVAIEFPLSIELSLSKGWKVDLSLEEAFRKTEHQDLSQGYTSAGIHRAQLRILVDGVPASKVLSRGQQKLMVYGLVLSLSQIIADRTDEPPLLLIDDLGAELDQTNTQRILNFLQTLATQLFITVLDKEKYQIAEESRVFHVKHGSTWNKESES